MHYDTGLFHRITKNLDTRVSLYYIVVDNYIVANSADVHHTDNSYGFNLDSVTFFGFEVEFNASLFEKLVVFGNYTYRKTDYDENKLLEDAILIELSPEHKANLSLRYKWSGSTMLTTDIRYMSERKTEGKVYTLDAFTIVDVGIELSVYKNTKVHAYAGNIFGEKYQEVYGFPLPEHLFGINVKMSFF